MKKIFTFSSLLFLLFTANAQDNLKPYEGFQGCGEYLAAGTVHSSVKTGYTLVVNEKTRSEYNFKIPIIEEPKFAPYVDKPLKAQIKVTKQIDGTKGEIEKVLNVDHRVPNPLHPAFDTGFRLIKKLECKK